MSKPSQSQLDRKAIVSLLTEHGPLTAVQMAELAGLRVTRVRCILRTLTCDGGPVQGRQVGRDPMLYELMATIGARMRERERAMDRQMVVKPQPRSGRVIA